MKKLYMILSVALILCFVVGCQDKAAVAELEELKAKVTLEEENEAALKTLAGKLQEAFDNQDMAALAQLYAEDATMVMPGEPEPVRGREAIEMNQAAFIRAMPDFNVEFTLVLISEDYIFFEGVTKGTFTGTLATPEGDIPPTGKSATIKFAFIAKVNTDGLIQEDRTYYDTAEFMRQLGLTE